MIKNPSPIDWSPVEKALEQGGALGYKMAIIETDKIFNKALEKKNFPGETVDKKIQNIQSVFSNMEKLNYARAIHDKIISEPNFEISGEETQHLIGAYYQAIIDITQLRHGALNIFTRIKFNIINLFRYKLVRWARNIILSIILFFIIVIFLNDTLIGKKITSGIVDIAHVVVYKILLYGGIGIVGILAIIGLVYWWEQKRGRNEIVVEE